MALFQIANISQRKLSEVRKKKIARKIIHLFHTH